MKPKYLLLVVLLISAILIPASGCQSEEYRAIELVPAESNIIAGIQISEIVNDQDIRDAYDKFDKEADQPQTVNEALDKITKESGIDIADFSSALIFGDINDIEQTEYFGFIAGGTFDESEFIKSVEENTGEKLSTSDYKGHKLYTSEDDEFSITFLNDKMLLGGSTGAVKDSIDVSQGDSEPLEGQLLDTYNRYRGALISLAMEIPEDSQDSLSDDPMMNEMPISVEAFGSIDAVGFSLDKEKETLSSRIEFHFLNTDSVQDTYDTISGMISMFKGMMEEPELKEFLGNIEVSASGSWMTIALEMELSEIEELMETAENNPLTDF